MSRGPGCLVGRATGVGQSGGGHRSPLLPSPSPPPPPGPLLVDAAWKNGWGPRLVLPISLETADRAREMRYSARAANTISRACSTTTFDELLFTNTEGEMRIRRSDFFLSLSLFSFLSFSSFLFPLFSRASFSSTSTSTITFQRELEGCDDKNSLFSSLSEGRKLSSTHFTSFLSLDCDLSTLLPS